MTSVDAATLRQAGVADAERIGLLAARLFVQAYGSTHPEPELSRYLQRSFSTDYFSRALAQGDRVLVAGDAADTDCGYAHLRMTHGAPPAGVEAQRAVELARFYVDEAWHGQGVAQVLMKGCEREALASGADALWLGVWQEAARPIAFYRRAGFTVVGTTTFEFGERRDADYLMMRTIARES